MSTLRDDGVMCSAIFSPGREYRYSLVRDWSGDPRSHVVFVGLNPSTADETTDDPTVRRCIRFARDWGAGGMVMLNLFAYRATDPRAMKRHSAPIGPGNDRCFDWYCDTARFVVCCWGAHGDHLLRGRYVTALLRNSCREKLRVFGLTKDGHPRHPLYLSKSSALEEWR